MLSRSVLKRTHTTTLFAQIRTRIVSRFIGRIAGSRQSDISGARSHFERPEDFHANIRTVLELRLSQVQGGDSELLKFVRRAVKHLPDEPDEALGSARDILDVLSILCRLWRHRASYVASQKTHV